MKIQTPPESLTRVEMTYKEWIDFHDIHKANLIYNKVDGISDSNFMTCYYSIGGRIIQTVIKEAKKE